MHCVRCNLARERFFRRLSKVAVRWDVHGSRFERQKPWVKAGNELGVSLCLSEFSTHWPHNCQLLLLSRTPSQYNSNTHSDLSNRPLTERISPHCRPSSRFWCAECQGFFQTTKDVLWAPPPKCVIFYLLKDGKNRTWKSPDCCLAACSWQQRNGEVLITTFCLSTSVRILFARDRNFLMTRLPVHPLRKDRITRRHKAECTVSKVPCGVQCNPLLDYSSRKRLKNLFDGGDWSGYTGKLLCACDAHKGVAFTFFLGLRSSVWNLVT